MIVATAIAEGLPLYTTNPADFTGLDALIRIIPVTTAVGSPIAQVCVCRGPLTLIGWLAMVQGCSLTAHRKCGRYPRAQVRWRPCDRTG
jgi:hypothetical protein